MRGHALGKRGVRSFDFECMFVDGMGLIAWERHVYGYIL